MRRLLILGFYGKANLGDDMFTETLPQLVPNFQCSFYLPSDFLAKNLNSADWDAIICGAGDIFNEYFFKDIFKIVKCFKGPIYALGMGIPYPSMFNSNYLSLLDHVFLREIKDLSTLSSLIGARYSHSLPDLGFMKEVKGKIKRKNKIGVFLAQPMTENKIFMEEFILFCQWLINQGHVLEFIRFNTSNTTEDDKWINDKLKEKLPQIINNLKIYNTDAMIKKIAGFKLAICNRFHSHVFAMVANTPFVSISMTRKVSLLLEEENLSEVIAAPENYRDMILKFQMVLENLDDYKNKLKLIHQKNKERLDTEQINLLLLRNDKRLDKSLIINKEEVYKEARRELFKLTGYDVETDLNQKINQEAAQKISSLICYNLTNTIGSKYEWGTTQNIIQNPKEIKAMIDWISNDFKSQPIKHKLDFNYYNQELGEGIHRAGWDFVLSSLKTLQGEKGVLCDTFMDRSFIWGRWLLTQKGILPYTSPWIGFVHHTPNTEFTQNNCWEMINSKEFKLSLPTCKGIICLSNYLADWFKERVKVPILTLYHPTLFVDKLWISSSSRNLITVGSWYRNPFTIYAIKAPQFNKQRLNGSNSMLPPEKFKIIGNNPDTDNLWVKYMWKYISKKYPRKLDYVFDSEQTLDPLVRKVKKMIDSVEIIPKLSNEEYDTILSNSVVFLDLIDASAANTIIECIVRNVPICVNKHPAVEEYLGQDYPLYWESPDQVSEVLTSENIEKAHNYLKEKDKSYLHIETFMDKLTSSSLWKNLI